MKIARKFRNTGILIDVANHLSPIRHEANQIY